MTGTSMLADLGIVCVAGMPAASRRCREVSRYGPEGAHGTTTSESLAPYYPGRTIGAAVVSGRRSRRGAGALGLPPADPPVRDMIRAVGFPMREQSYPGLPGPGAGHEPARLEADHGAAQRPDRDASRAAGTGCDGGGVEAR